MGQDSAEVLALCATHIEAAQAAVAASVTAGSPAAYAPPAADWAAGCFAAAAAAAPGLVNPMLLDAIHTALVPLAQVSGGIGLVLSRVICSGAAV